MKSNERIITILKRSESFFFATVEDGRPKVRPFNTVMEFEDKIYFYTNNHKSAFKQMQDNPNIEICAMIGEDRWLRLSGQVVWDYRREAKRAMIENNPELKNKYSEDDKIFEVFYLSNVEAVIHSLYSEREVICWVF